MSRVQSSPAGYLLDMDGVIYRGLQPIPGAAQFLAGLRQNRIPFLLLTNHSCLTPAQVRAKLAKMEILVRLDNIYTSSLATASWLQTRGVTSAFIIGEDGLKQALRKAGIRHDAKNPSHVVVGFERQLDYRELTLAYRFIAAGVPFIATNPDPTYPIEDGPAPECGYLLGALTHLTGVTPRIIGKPSRPMFALAAQKLGLPAKKLVMVGDRLDIDIIGAQQAGMGSILVTTGHTTPAMARRAPIKADRVVANLLEI